MHARRMWKAFPNLALAALTALPALGCQAAPVPASVEEVDSSVSADFEAVRDGMIGSSRSVLKTSWAQGASPAPEPSPRETGAPAARESAPERMLIQRAELRLAVSSPEEVGKMATRVAK